MSCPACDHPDMGYQHSCPGSGTFLAAEAHDEGAVLEPVVWPTFEAQITVTILAAGEPAARARLGNLMAALLDDDDLTGCEFTIRERAGVAA